MADKNLFDLAAWLVEELGYPFDVHFTKPAPIPEWYLPYAWANHKMKTGEWPENFKMGAIANNKELQMYRQLEKDIEEALHGG